VTTPVLLGTIAHGWIGTPELIAAMFAMRRKR